VLEIRRIATQGGRRVRRPYSLVPYAAVAAVQVLLGVLVVNREMDARAVGVLIGVVVITILVMVRQLISFEDNTQLLTKLDQTLLTVRQQEERFRSLVQHASDLIAVLGSDGRVQYASPSVRRLLGFDSEAAQRLRIDDLVHPDDADALTEFLASVVAVPGSTHHCDVRLRTAAGSWRWLGVIGTNLLDEPGVGGIVCNARDITDARQLQDRLHHQANHDPLTGLANRSLFQAQLDLPAPTDGEDSILLIDLDDFKPVNDLLGHHVGDALLIEVATRLRLALRATDTVARLGGDEFAVFLPGAGAAEAERAVRRIRDAFAEPMAHEGSLVPLLASIGSATAPRGDGEALLRAADQAMYEAKRAGKQRRPAPTG
jgi:diguanylate cyclase (GGDEF)-like protein/PAS domain S-box-containing protein